MTFLVVAVSLTFTCNIYAQNPDGPDGGSDKPNPVEPCGVTQLEEESDKKSASFSPKKKYYIK